MDILFLNSRRRKDFNERASLIRKYGQRRADLIQQRMAELMAAEFLEDIRNLPGPHCHELGQNRKGQLAVNLDHPYRLIFEPADEPIPLKPDGGLNWNQVTAIRILEVVDYHG